MSTFWQRLLSGIAYIGLVIASILVHPIFFGVLFVLVTMLAVHEYHHLVGSTRLTTIGASLAGGLLFAILWCFFQVETINIASLACMQSVYAVVVVLLLLAELWLKQADPVRNWGNILISQVMIAFPFACMNLILDSSKYLLLALFITIWVNDTAAYCVGCLTAKRKNGNHKMFPRVSPKKSWEGLIGGFVFSLLTGYILYLVGWIDSLPKALVFTAVIAVAGTLGDLMESLLKRTIGVKDSGRFMPGHGGVLDRFDSILLATPAVALLLIIFG